MIHVKKETMTLKSAFWRTLNFIIFKFKDIKLGTRPDIKYRVYLNKHKNGKIVIGDNFAFYSDCNINPLTRNLRGSIWCEEGAEIIIGNNVGISASSLWANNSITIKDRVTVGADCIFLDNDSVVLNYKNRGTTNDVPASEPILVEEDVLIGARSIILKGVTIGARSVIGCGSVVTNNIPPDCIAAGNPCKVIRKVSDWDTYRGNSVAGHFLDDSDTTRHLDASLGGVICKNPGAKLVLDNNVNVGTAHIWSHNDITIGEDSVISDGVMILDSDCHSLNYADRGTPDDAVNKTDKPIKIGKNVCIGCKSIILKGVCIGDGSIIKPGSVVTKDIPANCIAAGNPAKVIGKIENK